MDFPKYCAYLQAKLALISLYFFIISSNTKRSFLVGSSDDGTVINSGSYHIVVRISDDKMVLYILSGNNLASLELKEKPR